MQEQAQETTETVTEPTQEVTEQTLEEQQGHLKEIATFNHKVYSALVTARISALTKILRSNNGVSELKKIQAEKALFEAVSFAMDFGVGTNGAKIRDRGTVLASETNELAGVLVKAMDNRMLLVALNKEEADEAATETETNTVVETTGVENV